MSSSDEQERLVAALQALQKKAASLEQQLGLALHREQQQKRQNAFLTKQGNKKAKTKAKGRTASGSKNGGTLPTLSEEKHRKTRTELAPEERKKFLVLALAKKAGGLPGKTWHQIAEDFSVSDPYGLCNAIISNMEAYQKLYHMMGWPIENLPMEAFQNNRKGNCGGARVYVHPRTPPNDRYREEAQNLQDIWRHKEDPTIQLAHAKKLRVLSAIDKLTIQQLKNTTKMKLAKELLKISPDTLDQHGYYHFVCDILQRKESKQKKELEEAMAIHASNCMELHYQEMAVVGRVTIVFRYPLKLPLNQTTRKGRSCTCVQYHGKALPCICNVICCVCGKHESVRQEKDCQNSKSIFLKGIEMRPGHPRLHQTEEVTNSLVEAFRKEKASSNGNKSLDELEKAAEEAVFLDISNKARGDKVLPVQYYCRVCRLGFQVNMKKSSKPHMVQRCQLITFMEFLSTPVVEDTCFADLIFEFVGKEDFAGTANALFDLNNKAKTNYVVRRVAMKGWYSRPIWNIMKETFKPRGVRNTRRSIIEAIRRYTEARDDFLEGLRNDTSKTILENMEKRLTKLKHLGPIDWTKAKEALTIRQGELEVWGTRFVEYENREGGHVQHYRLARGRDREDLVPPYADDSVEVFPEETIENCWCFMQEEKRKLEVEEKAKRAKKRELEQERQKLLQEMRQEEAKRLVALKKKFREEARQNFHNDRRSCV